MFRYTLRAALGLGVSLLASVQTHAQLEEIVVTATKRGTVDMQDVPIAIAQVGGEFLDAVGAEEFLSFSRKLGIQAEDSGPGEKRFIIRGLNANGAATVGLYYDDIPTTGFGSGGSGNGQPDFRVLDLERVEILRGPQGTLYGAGSVGGTIRYVTRKPNLERFEGNVALDLSGVSQGGGSRQAIEGVIDIPIVENALGLRIVGFDSHADGITNNNFLQIEGSDFRDAAGGRAILRWLPTNSATVTASYWKQDSEVGDRTEYNPTCNPSINSCYLDPADGGLAPPTAAPAFSSDDHHISTQGITNPFDEDMDIFGLNIAIDTDNGTFTSTSSYFDRSALTAFDSSDFSGALFGDPSSVLPVSVDQDTQLFSQEFIWSSSLDGNVNFVLGAFFQDRSDVFRQRAVLSLPTPGATGRDLINHPEPSFVVSNFFPPPINSGVIFDNQLAREYTNTAFFGEVSWQVTDRFAIDAGLRRFELENELVETKLQNPDFTILFLRLPDEGGVVNQSSFEDVIFKLTGSLDFTDDTMGYLTFSEGFREGGVNPLRTAINLPLGYEPDTVTNYEAGLKATMADGQFVANLAYFAVDWENLQVSVSDPTGLFGLRLNLQDGADVNGFELETAWAPASVEGLQILFGAQWTDTEFSEDIPDLDRMGNPIPGNPMFQAVVGDPIPQVADLTLSASVQYDFPAFGQQAMFLVDWSYTGDSFSTNSPRNPFGGDLGDYHVVNLRFGLTGENWGGWNATLYARNLFDENGRVYYDDRREFFGPGQFSNGPTVITTYPRTIGLSLRKDF